MVIVRVEGNMIVEVGGHKIFSTHATRSTHTQVLLLPPLSASFATQLSAITSDAEYHKMDKALKNQ